MLEKAEIIETMKSTWRLYRDYGRYGNDCDNITDEGAYRRAFCVEDLYRDYQKLKAELKRAAGAVTCPKCGKTIAPVKDECPECGVGFIKLWNQEWDRSQN